MSNPADVHCYFLHSTQYTWAYYDLVQFSFIHKSPTNAFLLFHLHIYRSIAHRAQPIHSTGYAVYCSILIVQGLELRYKPPLFFSFLTFLLLYLQILLDPRPNGILYSLSANQ